MSPFAAAVLLLGAIVDPAPADWPQFRGAAGTSFMESRVFPAAWGEGENVAWQRQMEGSGWSSPIVIGDRIFVTSAVSGQGGPKGFQSGVTDPTTRGQGAARPTEEYSFRLQCLRLLDGDLLWDREVASLVPAYGVHASNTFATESPTTDGERIFVTFGAVGHVVAFDFDGEELWRVDTGVYSTSNDFGWGSSLVAIDDLVFLQNDNQQSSFVVALDAKTGEERWRDARPKGSSWATPTVWRHEARTELVTAGPGVVTAYDPPTGDVLWKLTDMGGSFSASLTFDANRLYFGNSGPMSRGPLLAMEAGAEGEVFTDEAAWMAPRSGPGFSSPVVAKDMVYVTASGGILACHDAATGDRLYRTRLPDAATVVASPWIAGDELFILDETGKTFVVRVADEFELVRANQLEGLFWSTPTVTGSNLLLRSADQLYCIRPEPRDV